MPLLVCGVRSMDEPVGAHRIYCLPNDVQDQQLRVGAIRRFAGWVASGSVGRPMLEGINYWDELRDSPSQLETCFAIFVNDLDLDDSGQPVNEKYAEKRAATWIYQYCTGKLPPGQPALEPWKTELY
jgi:hypothetical protein